MFYKWKFNEIDLNYKICHLPGLPATSYKVHDISFKQWRTQDFPDEAPTSDVWFGQISQKLHENEKNLGPEREHMFRPPNSPTPEMNQKLMHCAVFELNFCGISQFSFNFNVV